jgi:hypothetical protein
MFKNVRKEFRATFSAFSRDNENIISVGEFEKNSVMAFNDFILQNQNNVKDYFTRGRHKDIDLFYLAQTFSKVPKQVVRDNTNFLCLFQEDITSLKHVYDEFVGGEVSFEDF